MSRGGSVHAAYPLSSARYNVPQVNCPIGLRHHCMQMDDQSAILPPTPGTQPSITAILRLPTVTVYGKGEREGVGGKGKESEEIQTDRSKST